MTPSIEFHYQDALLIVDVQNDFCQGGSLAIAGADAIIPVLNDWIDAAIDAGILIFVTRDWHPVGHVSFKQHGGIWPVHCVQETEGAQFHPALHVTERMIRVSKGTRFDQDAYSAFDGTGLASFLRRFHIQRLWIGGLAEDVCVMHTALDAMKEGFEAHLIRAATRPVHPEKESEVLETLRNSGVIVEG